MKSAVYILILICLCSNINCFDTCTAEAFDVFSSGWSATEVVTTTPQCPSCTDCLCTSGPVDAGLGQPGTETGGPCATLSSYDSRPCYGYSKAIWTLRDNFISSSIGIQTNEQTLIGNTNMSPPGIFDTGLPSNGLYAIKLSTTGSDDDWMGFVFGYEPMTVERCASNRIEFEWKAQCC